MLQLRDQWASVTSLSPPTTPSGHHTGTLPSLAVHGCWGTQALVYAAGIFPPELCTQPRFHLQTHLLFLYRLFIDKDGGLHVLRAVCELVS